MRLRTRFRRGVPEHSIAPHGGAPSTLLLALLLLAGILDGPTAAAAAGCKLEKVAELPVTMSGLRPMVHAMINGNDALFIADSGAFYSLLTPAAAAEFKLRLRPAPYWFAVRGIGGEAAQTWLTVVKTFTIFNLPIPNVDFTVAGNDFGGSAAGLLGQNVLRLAGDVEYDLANGVIRLIRTDGCGDAPLAYWATSQPYSVIDIDRATATMPHTTGAASVNGARIRVMFDTGASTSVLTVEAAKRAGVTPGSQGVVPAGPAFGVGRQLAQTWIAPFASFKIGDEEIRNTHLRIGAGVREADMLIGADFFLSHHVYVANSQRKLYFTYNGGPVFNLTTTPGAAANSAVPGSATSGGAPVSAAPGGSPAAASSAPVQAGADSSPTDAGEPGDAGALARRGAAFAARHDFTHAIAELTRACQLDPTEASYFYQRGLAYWGKRQPDLALSDFDQALKLKPGDLPSLVARADLHLLRKETAAAIADLDAADRAAAKEADVRIHMGNLYLYADQFASAVVQYTDWIDSHPRDVHMSSAQNQRCWTRALWGQELDLALSDCDAALRTAPKAATLFASRGLVRLRRGDYDKAIADYDQALALRPRDAWPLYGRGVAKLRKGNSAAGHDDIAAATALTPTIAELAAKRGITP